MPYYAEHCAAMLASTYSSGQGPLRNIVSQNLFLFANMMVMIRMELDMEFKREVEKRLKSLNEIEADVKRWILEWKWR